jgi:hypothetical protein
MTTEKKSFERSGAESPEAYKNSIYKEIEKRLDKLTPEVIQKIEAGFLESKKDIEKMTEAQWKSMGLTLDVLRNLATKEDPRAYLESIKLAPYEHISLKMPGEFPYQIELEKLLVDLSAYLSLKKPAKAA